MFCINCGAELRDGGKFCPNCGLEQENPNLINNPQKSENVYDKSSRVEPEYSSDYENNTTEESDYIQQKIDDYIDKIEEKNKEQPVIEKINFLLDVIHKNIIYDENLKDFAERKEAKEGIFKGFYNYKNSVNEVIKNKKGTCIGFSNAFKSVCEKSGIDCKTMIYKNDTRKFNHQLNIVFDNGKKYYVDPTWGFIVDNLETLKQIYRGEINNPRTNTKIGTTEIENSSGNYKIDKPNSKDTRFMTIVVLATVAAIGILVIISWLTKNR